MAEARTRSVRIRSRAAGLLAAAYMVAFASFWIAGATAYLKIAHGFGKLLGFLYFPILLLPLGDSQQKLGALEIHSPVWLWWFALQMVFGIAAIWVYPYERRRPSRIDPGPRALTRASTVARSSSSS
jgi:hypothetical protein